MSTAQISTYVPCPICQIPQNDRLVELHRTQTNVSHIFHEKCVRPWVEKYGTCPLDFAELSDEEISRVVPPHPFDAKNQAAQEIIKQSLTRLLNGLSPATAEINRKRVIYHFQTIFKLIKQSYPASESTGETSTTVELEACDAIQLMLGMGTIHNILGAEGNLTKIDAIVLSIIISLAIKKNDRPSLLNLLTHQQISEWDLSNKLIEAIHSERVEIAGDLIARGARLDDAERGHSLETAAENDNLELVELLLQHGSISEAHRQNAIQKAQELGYLNIADRIALTLHK